MIWMHLTGYLFAYTITQNKMDVKMAYRIWLASVSDAYDIKCVYYVREEIFSYICIYIMVTAAKKIINDIRININRHVW